MTTRILLPFTLLIVCAPSFAVDGQKSYAERCAACHGERGEGSDRAPKLADSRTLRTRTTDQLRRFLHDGAPSVGMPSFHIDQAELQTLAELVHSWNLPASYAHVPGSPEAGERFFFSTGNCASCHMVRGQGKVNGPDLSNVGRQMTAGEMRDKLRDPDAHITPGYELVNVQLRDGHELSGFARGQTNFDLQLQTLDGRLVMLQSPNIASVRDAKHSPMKPLVASPDETRDLIAYLSSLTGSAPRGAETPYIDGISYERILHPQLGDWPTYNGNVSGNRYSELNQINTANIATVAVKWIFPIDHFGIETTPVVVDGIMYVTGPNQCWALDALTGRPIWHYQRPRTSGLVGDASLGTNRGVAVLGDKVFMSMDNAHLIALHRLTGALLWDTFMPEEPQHYGSTVAPLVVKDTVISGVSGGDWGIRGFVAGFKASTGEMLWRRWTIPLNGEAGADTWKGAPPLYGGGSTWLTGSYDPETDTLFWPTGNPWPDSMDLDRPGDNLYTNSILALYPHTGEIKWYFQFTPHDTHDWDATEPPVLVDTEYQGQPRKLMLHADRNGFFYVLDRTNGHVLLTKSFARKMTWANGIGPDGRPQPVPGGTNGITCPTDAANWGSTAYSPRTRLYYVLTKDECHVERGPNSWKTDKHSIDPAQKILRAIDIDTGKVAWEIPFVGTVIPKTWPGILATAGGLVFYADPNGAIAAADERTGKTLWHLPTNVYMKASPMTFGVNGKQFLAWAVGPNIMCFGLPDR